MKIRNLKKCIACILALVLTLTSFPAIALASENPFARSGNQWDVTMEFATDFLQPWNMAEAWVPEQGWIGNGGGGHNMGMVTGTGTGATAIFGPDVASRAARGRVLQYNTGSSPRGGQANLHVPVESNYRIDMEFEWFPGIPVGTGATAYGKVAINDSHNGGFSNSGGMQANQFINFISSNWSQDTAADQGLTFVIGNVLDSVAFRGGAGGNAGATMPLALNHVLVEEGHPEDGQLVVGVRHPFGTNANREEWLTINLSLDFVAQEITVHITVSETGQVLVNNEVHPFAHQTDATGPFGHWNSDGSSGFWTNHTSGTSVTRMGQLGGGAVTWNRQVAGFRFFNAGHWRTQIDNMTIQGLVPYVPPVLVGATNLNAARGTFDLEIAPYSIPPGATLNAINIFATTTIDNVTGPEVLVATVAGAGTHTINVPRGNATHVITAEAVVNGTHTSRSNALTVVHSGVVVPRPLTVTNMTITAQRGQMNLSWVPIANADEYIIYRAFFERGPFERIGVVTAGNAIVDTHPRLAPNFHTFYKIEAIGDAGSGGLSQVFRSTLSGYVPAPRTSGQLCRALVGINLAGDRGAETLVSAAGPNGETLTSGVYLSWRWFNADETHNTTFTLYRNGIAIYTGLTVTNLVDPAGGPFDVYRVVGSSDALQNITSPGIRVWTNFYNELQLFQPPMQTMLNGRRVTYVPNDIIVGDLTGDGTLDMVVKWFPTNALDASIGGQTGSVFFDAYTVDWNTGETVLLWRIDLGWNMRASSHYQMFGLADFRGIGRQDVMMNAPTSARFFRSLDGTDQSLVELDYRVGSGVINVAPTTSNSGCSHIIAIDGVTGALIGAAVRPTQAITHERFSAAAGYVRGHDQRPSFITGGQYGALQIREYRITGTGPWQVVLGWDGPATGGNINHNIHTADIHGLGFDSILGGGVVIVPNVINENATGSAAVAGSTGFRILNNVGVHGNSSQFGPFISYEVMFEMMVESNQLPPGVTSPDDLRLPNNHPRQVIALGQEGQGVYTRPSFIVRDVLSGATLVTWNSMPYTDMRRGMIAHVDPSFPNAQTWADKSPTYLDNGNWGPPARDGSWDERESGMFSLERFADHTRDVADRRGELHQIAPVNPSMNFSLFWSGDLLSELQCHDFNERAGFYPISTQITKWDHVNQREILLFDSTEVFTNNGTKGTPATQADIVGDWREEVIFRDSNDPSIVRIYRTTIQTDYVIPWLWEDHNYRLAMTWQANGYNQPPGTSFMPSRGVVLAQDLDYYTLSSTAGVVVTYSPASSSYQFGFPITGHQLWRRNGNSGNIDLTPRGTLSNSTRIQLLEAGYTLVAEAVGDAPLVDTTALVGGTYTFVVIGVSETATGLKMNHFGQPMTITVADRSANVASVTVAPATYVLTTAGQAKQLAATVSPQNARNRNVAWSSSNELVATVSADGVVTAVGNGTATIRATSVLNPAASGASVITVNIPVYTVTFMLDEHEVFLVRDTLINAAMGARFPLNPFRTGYSFVGWFTALEGGDPFTAGTVVNADMTVYARFSPAGTVAPGDRWQFNFRMPASPDTPAGWIEIPLGAANDTWAAETPRLPDSMVEIDNTGVMFGVGYGPDGAGPSTRGGHTTAAGWWGQNPSGLTGVDRFGSTIHVPRDVGTGWVSLMELGIVVPNGAFDVIAILGNAVGGAPRGGLIIHGEPRNTSVRISANPTNAAEVPVSRAVVEIPGNQNVDNNRPFALSHANNIIVRDGYLGVTPYQWNLNTQGFIVVVVALHAPIEEAIAAAALLNQANYSVASWSALMEAIQAGQAAMLTGSSNYVPAYSQAAIDAFAQDILDAIDALEVYISGNARLANLEVVGYTLSPAFAPNVTTSYAVTVAANTDNVDLIITTASSSAMVVVSVNGQALPAGTTNVGLEAGNNTITITVTAEDGVTVRVYTITVSRSEVETYNVTIASPGATGYSGFGAFAVGDTVTINAGIHDEGYEFAIWTSTPAVTFENATHSATTFAMIASNVTLTANWASPSALTVTVNNSHATNSGAGIYEEGDMVTINAGTRAGYRFVTWNSNPFVSFEDINSPTTRFAMPDTSVIATATWVRIYVPEPEQLPPPIIILVGSVVSWEGVPGAVGYAVYANNNRIATLGADARWFNLAGRLGVGDHTIRVRAIGDGVEFANSELSNTVIHIIFPPVGGGGGGAPATTPAPTPTPGTPSPTPTPPPPATHTPEPGRVSIFCADYDGFVEVNIADAELPEDFIADMHERDALNEELLEALIELAEGDIPALIRVYVGDLSLNDEQLIMLVAFEFDPETGLYEIVRGFFSADRNYFYAEIENAGIVGFVFYERPIPLLRLTIGQVNYCHNGVPQISDVAPFISGNRTMVPLRLISEALGATPRWDSANRVAYIYDGETVLRLSMGQPLPGGLGIPEMRNNRVFVPARFVIENFNAITLWNAELQEVTVYTW